MACASADARDVWCSCHLTAPRRRTVAIIFTEYWLVIYVAKRQGLIEADQEINCISQLSHDGTCPHHSIPGSSICTEKSTWYCSPSVNQFGKYSLTMEPLSFAKRILWHTWNSILTDDGLDCSSEPILSIWRSTELRKGGGLPPECYSRNW